MSSEHVTKFLEKVSTDADFRTRLERASEGPGGGEEVRKIVTDAGFSFSPKEFRDTVQALQAPAASDADLDAVVGGLALSPISSTLLTRGTNLYNNFATSGGMIVKEPFHPRRV